jgi:hypothetical protein
MILLTKKNCGIPYSFLSSLSEIVTKFVDMYFTFNQ